MLNKKILFAHFRVTVIIFWGPAPSLKATFQIKLLDVLKQFGPTCRMPNFFLFKNRSTLLHTAQYPPPPILAAVNIFANPLIEGVYNKALATNNLHFLQQAMARKKGVHPTAGISITVWWGGGGGSRGGWGINGALLKVVRKYFTRLPDTKFCNNYKMSCTV